MPSSPAAAWTPLSSHAPELEALRDQQRTRGAYLAARPDEVDLDRSLRRLLRDDGRQRGRAGAEHQGDARDREQLSRLVDAHVAAATPGEAVPAAMLLNDLERPVGEDIIAPWVTDVATLVALHHDRLVGAAHLRRYADDDRASESYRDAGEIAWLVCRPDHLQAGMAVHDQSIARLGEWGVRIYYGDGAFPAPGVHGVPGSWPHVRTLYEEAGFDPSDGQVQIIVAGEVDQLPATLPSTA